MRKFLCAFVLTTFCISPALAEQQVFDCQPTRGGSTTDDLGFKEVELSELSPFIVRVEPSQRRAAVVLNREGAKPIPFVYELVASDRSTDTYNFQINSGYNSAGLLIWWNDDGSGGTATRYTMHTAGSRWFADYVCTNVN